MQIKAVGIVTDPAEDLPDFDLGTRVGVEWRWKAEPLTRPLVISKMNDKADFMRRGSLYEELNPQLQKRIVNLLLGRN